MKTAWAVAAAAVALPLAGIVRTRILAFSVPYGQPPQLACPSCQTAVIATGRRGSIAWLPANGRCRSCGTRIGPSAAAVEVVLAITVGSLVYTSAALAALPALLWLAAVGVTLAFVDLATRRLPDRFTAAAFAAAALVVVVQMLAGGGWSQGLRAVAAAAITAGFYFMLTLIGDGGFGDVKLGLTTGLLLGAHGWAAVAIGGLLSVLITAVVGTTLRLTGRLKPGDDFAHGPSMLVGVVVTIVAFVP
jgi:leader peptidase (prepilin peptidase)/N-methyltransferase